MTNAEKLMKRYERSQAILDIAVLHPDSSKYTIAQAIEMVEKARAKVLKALEDAHNDLLGALTASWNYGEPYVFIGPLRIQVSAVYAWDRK